MNVIPYLEYRPSIPKNVTHDRWVSIIGRTAVGENCHFSDLVTLRADGESIDIGNSCWFGDYATVHIADSMFGVTLGDNVTVGRFGLVHACKIEENCILGEHAVVMDNATVGKNSVICSNSVVPPGKKLESGWIYQGVPAKPVRELTSDELEQLRSAVKNRQAESVGELVVSSSPVPDIVLDPGHGVTKLLSEQRYIAPTAAVDGDLTMDAHSSIWFGVEINAAGAAVHLGEASNIQDNSRVTLEPGEKLTIGQRVTIGHNVQIHSGTIGNHCIIGMGSTLGKGTVVEDGGVVAAGAITEPNTVVAAGMIWSGNPARQSRPLSEENAKLFSIGVDVYKLYTKNYNAQS